jgi:hypothetical protein
MVTGRVWGQSIALKGIEVWGQSIAIALKGIEVWGQESDAV